MATKLRLGLAGAVLVTGVTTACEDLPLLPRWDAPFVLPIASRGVAFNTVGFPANLPAGTFGPVPVSTPVETQPLDGTVGDALNEKLRGGSLIFTVSSDLPVDGSGTLFVANSSAALAGGPSANRIDAPFTIAASASSVTDTVAIPQAGITMLLNAAAAEDTLHIQLRGSFTYNSPTARTVTASDSLTVRIQCSCIVAVSR